MKLKIYKEMDEKQLMIEDITAQMATWLIDENGMTRIDALRTIYNSMTYIKLQDTANGLFAQGTPYIYDCLMQEIQNGKVF